MGGGREPGVVGIIQVGSCARVGTMVGARGRMGRRPNVPNGPSFFKRRASTVLILDHRVAGSASSRHSKKAQTSSSSTVPLIAPCRFRGGRAQRRQRQAGHARTNTRSLGGASRVRPQLLAKTMGASSTHLSGDGGLCGGGGDGALAPWLRRGARLQALPQSQQADGVTVGAAGSGRGDLRRAIDPQAVALQTAPPPARTHNVTAIACRPVSTPSEVPLPAAGTRHAREGCAAG